MDSEVLIRTECTLFFEENPYAVLTASGLAERMGRKVEHIEPVLVQLVECSILIRTGGGKNKLYRYAQPDAIEIR